LCLAPRQQAGKVDRWATRGCGVLVQGAGGCCLCRLLDDVHSPSLIRTRGAVRRVTQRRAVPPETFPGIGDWHCGPHDGATRTSGAARGGIRATFRIRGAGIYLVSSFCGDTMKWRSTYKPLVVKGPFRLRAPSVVGSTRGHRGTPEGLGVTLETHATVQRSSRGAIPSRAGRPGGRSRRALPPRWRSGSQEMPEQKIPTMNPNKRATGIAEA
jgi:hypothetical protein